MLKPDELPLTREGLTQRDYEILRQELLELQAMNRTLRRQLEKASAATIEAQRAHAKMVGTLTETMRENTELCNDRDLWRTRAQRLESGFSAEPEDGPTPVINIGALAGQITEEEANAIRKAMARLHHPDLGGSPDRMKAWNAALDRLDRS